MPSNPKIWGTFFQKKILGGGFSSNLDNVNLKSFPIRWDIHLKMKPDHSIELWSDLSLRLTSKRFQRLYHVQFSTC